MQDKDTSNSSINQFIIDETNPPIDTTILLKTDVLNIYLLYGTSQQLDESIFDKNATVQQLKNNFTLVKISKYIVKYLKLVNNMKLVKREYLINFDNTITEDAYVVVMPYLSNIDGFVNTLINCLDPKHLTFNDVCKLFTLYNINKCIISERFDNAIYSADYMAYWKDPMNCAINYSNIFRQRTLDIVPKYMGTNSYGDIAMMNKRKCNVGTVARKRYTKPSGVPKIQLEDVTAMINNIYRNSHLLYTFVNSILLSKDYCHYIVNNKQNLETLNELFVTWNPIYKYIFGYAWNTMLLEEYADGVKISTKNRYIFDINTASVLPEFDLDNENIHNNPYVKIHVNRKEFANNNIMKLRPMNQTNKIVDMETFLKNMHSNTCNVLKFIDFDGSICVTGSVIPRYCVNTDGTKYASADIDILCKHASTTKFIKKVNNIYASLNASKNESKIISIDKKLTKTMYITILRTCLYKLLNKQESENDQCVKDFTSESVKNALYDMYLEKKKARNEENKENYIDAIFEYVTLNETSFTLSDIPIEQQPDDIIVYNESKTPICRISENIKFNLTCKFKTTTIDLELFNIKCNDFFEGITKFHLACVRGYYDGKNCYLLPSCITALKTNIIIDTKLYGNKNKIIQILKKYNNRGFSVLLNKQEEKLLTDIDFDNIKLSEKHKYNNQHDYEDDEKKEIKFLDVFERQNYSNYLINYNNLHVINEQGFIVPIKTELITEAYYDIVNGTHKDKSQKYKMKLDESPVAKQNENPNLKSV
jgi:hypothetical protein